MNLNFGELILETLNGLKANGDSNIEVEQTVKKKVIDLCSKFPIYS